MRPSSKLPMSSLPVSVQRLWAVLPGTATTGGTDAIWFSAGIGNEMHGLVGTFKAAP
jgi:hypothetical protein